jgi:hypothetical protein
LLTWSIIVLAARRRERRRGRQAHTLQRHGLGADGELRTVRVGQEGQLGGRAVGDRDAVELGVGDGLGDLVAQAVEVRLQGVELAVFSEVSEAARAFSFILPSRSVTGVAGGQGHVDGRLAALQRVLHGVQRIGGGRLVLGHRPDRAVVLGVADLLAGVDTLLRNTQFAVGGVQVLQGDHRAAFVLMLFSAIGDSSYSRFRRHFDGREHFAHRQQDRAKTAHFRQKL